MHTDARGSESGLTEVAGAVRLFGVSAAIHTSSGHREQADVTSADAVHEFVAVRADQER